MALTVSIVSAAEEVWSGEASQVIAKTTEGEIGILRGHEPVLAVLAAEGQVRVTDASGTVHTVEAADGFLSVDHDRVEIVARNAKLA
ncbi:F0F1 ATP synthase subunit epsilon [Agrococcus sp. ARC_14]|uniref:F0F1 ATP synthase subunit epsilon n=1 Tax=Agrococcus sp. ARC_14 TaxID=2919927 RepID=UPI001F05DED4|nr:F0F1 ATP synthase subunit epsilon [Agrococcus sp. ARC_14]MCH1883688.1 F0F1 ATP synthase subunit epsilon [Agrococcus sp. ARC_14]